MNKQFTASEVRGWERAYKGTGAAKVFGAFAELLAAQEKEVPVMVVNHVSSAEHDLPIGMELYAHPSPSDAERLAEALQEILDYRGGAANALEDEYVVDRAHQALAAHSAQAQPPANTERLAELLRGLEIGPMAAMLSPKELFAIGAAIAAQAKEAQPPAASVTDEMIERARSAFVQADDGSTGITDAIRAVLLAAHLAYPQPSRDAKDAARYRWLRDSADSYTWYYLGGIGADRVDAAVDAAMAKESGQ